MTHTVQNIYRQYFGFVTRRCYVCDTETLPDDQEIVESKGRVILVCLACADAIHKVQE